MTLHRDIDKWFLGFTTRAVYAKKSTPPSVKLPTKRKGIKAGFGLRNLAAAAKKHPEVMVKIPRRHSQNSKGLHGIRNHLDYISRNGEIPIETHSGEKLDNKERISSLLNDWKKLGIPEESRHREAINIVLSMPAGTPPEAVLNAARAFAEERFNEHQYAFALHHESDRAGEPPHPHVHLCVLIQNEYGERLNPRKNDLFEWRVHFAEKLRDEGVQCAATRRQHRGKTQKAEKSEIRAIRQRGVLPETVKRWQIELADALQNGREPHNPFQSQAEKTRQRISQEYAQIAKVLYQQGYKTEARLMSQLKKQLDAQPHETQAQQQYRQIRQQMQQKAQQQERKQLENQPNMVGTQQDTHPHNKPEAGQQTIEAPTTSRRRR